MAIRRYKRQGRFLGIIPARIGSRRLPFKNILEFHGEPLIARTIRAALNCSTLARVFVSTDSGQILELAEKMGCAHLDLRAKEMASDTCTSLQLLQYEVARLEALGEVFEGLVLLQPTSPLRTSEDVAKAIDIYKENEVTSVTSIVKVSHWKPDQEVCLRESNLFRQVLGASVKEDQDHVYLENGAVYVLDKRLLLGNDFYGPRIGGLIMPAERSVDIDTQEDFDHALKCFDKVHGSRN